MEYGETFATTVPTSAESFARWVINDTFQTSFWGPLGIVFGLGILIALVAMVYRRVRGTARRPR